MTRLAIEQRFTAGEALLEVLTCPDTERAPRAPLVFVHGAYVGAWCWAEHFLPWFAAHGFPVFALSLRGHGASGGRERLHGFGLDDYCADLAAIAAQLARPPVLIGHSMGALVVQKYFERQAGRQGPAASAAVFACPVPPFGLLAPSLWLAAGRPTLFTAMNALAAGGRASRAALRDALLAGPIDEATLEGIHLRMQGESRRAIADMTWWGLPQAWHLALPAALVLGAERDALIPHAMCQAAAQMLGADYRLLPGLGHALMLDTGWRSAAQAILDWQAGQGL